jgi:hypothetical protein
MPARHNNRLAVLRIDICSLADTFGRVDLNEQSPSIPARSKLLFEAVLGVSQRVERDRSRITHGESSDNAYGSWDVGWEVPSVWNVLLLSKVPGDRLCRPTGRSPGQV